MASRRTSSGYWLVVALLALGGCGKSPQTPEEIYAQAKAAEADEQWEKALALVPSEASLEEMRTAPELRARFRLMRAEMMALRRDNAAGLAMLEVPIGGSSDPAVNRQRRRSLGYGRCRGGRSAEERQAGLQILETVLAEAPALSAEAGNIELRRGACLRAMGEFEPAAKAFQSALRAAKASKDALLEAQALSSLGALMAGEERFDEAAAATREAIRVAARVGNPGRHLTRRAIDNLGWYLYELGDYERAMETFRQFQAVHTAEVVVNENNQARTLLALDDLEGAESHYGKALTAARSDTTVEASQQASVMQGLAALAYRRGKWLEAAKWNREAMGVIAKLRQPNLARIGRLTDARIRLAQGDMAGAEALLRPLLADAESSPQIRWSARTQLGVILSKTGRTAAAETEFQEAMRLVEKGSRTLSEAEDRIAFFSGRIGVYRAAIEFLLGQNRTGDALQVADRARSRSLRNGTARRVRRQGTILFYWLDEPASHLWVAGPAGPATYIRLPGAREIQNLVERHNQFLLRARNPLTEGGEEARKLYEILVKPAAAQLRGHKVFVSPDGGLHALNFETLIAPAPDRYWVEDVEIAVVPGLLGPAGESGKRGEGVLLAGDALPGEGGLAPLRHAGDELNQIGGQFHTTPMRGAAATAARVLAELGKNPTYVHLAAHAVANRLRPLDSSILFSPDEKGQRVYARDVAGIPMRPRLVTLSACTAAGARSYRGEGLVGFAWAFLGAGAENVVASLWEVDDASTPRLMDQMYRQIRMGRQPGEALRQAKLELLAMDNALRKPFFWGAFLQFQP